MIPKQFEYTKEVRKLQLNGIKIGIICSQSYQNKLQIQSFFSQIKELPNHITINSPGAKLGGDPYVKELTFDLNFTYQEYNPVYTPWNQYSALPTYRHGKKYSPKYIFSRYYDLIKNSDKLIIFVEVNSKDIIINAILKVLEKGKFNIPYIIVN